MKIRISKRQAERPTDPTDTRKSILEASVDLIEREGLSALSMREVARRAGVSHQAPYKHVIDREAILGALAEEGFEILRHRLSAARDASQSNARNLARSCFRAYVDFARSHPAHFRLMFRPELVNLDRCPSAKEAGARAFGCLTDVVREMILAGLPALPSEEALLTLMWSTSHGLACLILDGPLSKQVPRAGDELLIDEVTTAFVDMISARMSAAGGDKRKPARSTPATTQVSRHRAPARAVLPASAQHAAKKRGARR